MFSLLKYNSIVFICVASIENLDFILTFVAIYLTCIFILVVFKIFFFIDLQSFDYSVSKYDFNCANHSWSSLSFLIFEFLLFTSILDNFDIFLQYF